MKRYLTAVMTVIMLGSFCLSNIIPALAEGTGFGAYATENSASSEQETSSETETLDITGTVSFDNELTNTSATVTVSASGKDVSKIKIVKLSDGQTVKFNSKADFQVKSNGTYSAKIILDDGREIALAQSVKVDCIDSEPPVVKSAEYADEMVSKGSITVKAYVTEYVTKGCDKKYGKISSVYLIETKTGNKLSETNTLQSGGYYALEVSKNSDYQVFAVDKAGNVSEPCKVKVDVFDKDAPVIKTVSLDYTEDDKTKVEVLFTIEDGSEITELTVAEKESGDKIDYKKSSKGYSFIVGKNGVYTITATDKAGNKSTLDVTVDLKDIVPPEIIIDYNGEVPLGKDNFVEIGYTVTDLSGLERIYVNGESVTNLKKNSEKYSGRAKVKSGETLEIMAYDSNGNMSYESVKVGEGDAGMPVIISLEVTDITDTGAKAAVVIENSDGMKIQWYIQEPDGKWSKLAGNGETIDIYGLKRHSNYTVKAEVLNKEGAAAEKTASFTTLSMGTIRESDDSWMSIVAICVVTCVVVALTVFIIIFVKSKKPSEPEEELEELEDEVDFY